MPEGILKKIAINMERLRWAEMNTDTYVRINIPSFTLKFYRPDTTYLFKVIVGKPANPSPSLQSAIGYFTTAPEWKVPDKIFVKEILPKALANSAYLENSHFDIYSKKGAWIEPTRANLLMVRQNRGNYRATQSSGCDNALGLVVFRFPNIYDIYLHDTPEQKLFERDARAFSHGCIRVEQAEKLAGLVLQNDQSAGQIPAVHKAISTYTTKTFTLKKALPIEVIYVTCEVVDGILAIYPDIYDLDNNLGMALYQKYPVLSEVPIPLIIKQ
jgi:murein L,D-transpeptidase YcbB/YkuD